jgi:phosphoglycolate phosphatase
VTDRPERTVLFDLDGTLADSAALITEHLSAAIVGAGGPRFPPEDLRPLVGPPFEHALPRLGFTPEQVATVITAYRRSYGAVAATSTPLYPGIRAMLERLDGFRLAVATSKPEHLAVEIVEGVGLTDRFALVGGADHVLGRIGKGMVVGSVLERLGVDPAAEPVVMVGDRRHDVEGAAEHGIPTIGVAWGYAGDGELSGAELVVADAAELEAALRSGKVGS